MKETWPVFIAVLIYFLFSPFPTFAQVKINEFSSATNSDWVEIYNNSDETVDLTTYSLTDGSTSGNKKTFSCHLTPKGFWVIDWGDNLNNGGDIIQVKNGNQEVVDCVTYGNWATLCGKQEAPALPKLNDNNGIIEIGARDEDGIGGWRVVTINTKDGPNNGSTKDPGATCLAPSPSPSPSPSPGASPSPSPSNSSSESNREAAAPSPTPSPSPLPSPSKIARVKDIVLLELETPEPVLGTSSGEAKTNTKPIDWQLIIILLATGTGLLLATAFIMIKLWRKS